MNELVSIIIPTYRRPYEFEKSVSSLMTQTYKNIEVIIVDDNGIENAKYQKQTEENIQKYISLDSRIRYIKHEHNLGATIARNTGIKNARGEFICFLDDDDIYHDNKIESQMIFFKENNDDNLAFVTCDIEWKYPNKIIKTDRSIYFKDKNLLKTHLKNIHGIVGTPSFLIKKTILDEINGFENSKIRQEYQLILKILSKGYTGKYLSECLVTCNVSEESITRTKNEEKVQEFEKLLLKRLSYNILDKADIEDMKYYHLQDLVEWYTGYNLKKAIINWFKLVKMNRSKKEVFRLLIKILFYKQIKFVKKYL